jgi:hypothetical protein
MQKRKHKYKQIGLNPRNLDVIPTYKKKKRRKAEDNEITESEKRIMHMKKINLL